MRPAPATLLLIGLAWLAGGRPARAIPPLVGAPGPSGALPALRAPTVTASLAKPATPPDTRPPGPDRNVLDEQIATIRAAMAREVPGVIHPPTRILADAATRAARMLHAAGTTIEAPQLVVVVDRNPAAELLQVMVAAPDPRGTLWMPVGATHVSTGQSGRKDYYITPVGVFAHTDAILDFRALGTYNENGVRGLGVAGLRVWDFGWRWAVKGWRSDGDSGDIRLQMHGTDPDLLESRLGRPASEGCIRVSTAMNRFLDRYGVLDVDYERAAITDVSYRALLLPNRTPSPLAGRLLVVIDSHLPIDTAPTQASRPAGLARPGPASTRPGGGDRHRRGTRAGAPAGALTGRAVARWVLSAAYLSAGVLHISIPETFLLITPGWVPHPRDVILATGACEIAGAIGLQVPRFRRAAGVGLALYAVCVFPANIKHAIDGLPAGQVQLGWWYHAPRLLLQPVIVWWALYAGEVTSWPFRRVPSRSAARSATPRRWDDPERVADPARSGTRPIGVVQRRVDVRAEPRETFGDAGADGGLMLADAA